MNPFKHTLSISNICSLLFVLCVSNLNSIGQTAGNYSSLNMHQQLAYDIFRELIEINTTSENGTTKAAEAMAKRLLSVGFPERDIWVAGPDIKHKNLVARYRGSGKLKPVLFICHLDVVEAFPKDWSYDPFTFLEKEGYYYGRGTTDVKCEAADLIANLIRLRQEGFEPDRDIIVALTADEEGGSANGVEWLLNHHKTLIDADFCINPDGGGGDLKNGKQIAMSVQTSEKIYAAYELEANNKGGHSSLPSKDNAIYTLAKGLNRLAVYEFPVMLNETTRSLLKKRAAMENGQMRTDMLAIAEDQTDIEATNRVAAASPYYNAMIRTTCVATMMKAGHAENALPQSAIALVNCRLLPEDTPENILSRLKEIIADSAIHVKCTYMSFIAPLSPLRDEVMTPVEKVTESMWPGINIAPVMSTGASDGKYLRRSGMPVYGVSGMFSDIEDIRAHGKDERIGIKEFYEGVEFMYRFMKALTTEESL